MGYSKAPTDKDTMLISDRVVYNPASLFHVLSDFSTYGIRYIWLDPNLREKKKKWRQWTCHSNEQENI